MIRTTMQFGANGYIPKTAKGKALLMALKMVLEGETYLPPKLLEDDGNGGYSDNKDQSTSSARSTAGFEKMSEQEASVLRLLIARKVNKEIARA